MKTSLKSVLCNISYAINLPDYLGPFGKNKVIILMYHGIVKSYSQNPLKDIYGYNLSVKQFEGEMAYLAKHCNVITASEAISGQNISHNKKNVVITFDDGYRNNYTNAFPVLQKHDLPALFSISTSFVVNKSPLWNDLIEYAVINTKRQSANIRWEDSSLDFRLQTESERTELIKWLFAKCIEIVQEKREQFISHVYEKLEVSPDNSEIFKDPDYEPLLPEEVKILAEKNKNEIASHSENHYVLSRVDKNTLEDELNNSKSAIESITGSPCRYFCIPGGHFNGSVAGTFSESGYEKIFSSEYAEVTPGTTANIIGRFCINRNINIALFADIIHGPFHRLSGFIKKV